MTNRQQGKSTPTIPGVWTFLYRYPVGVWRFTHGYSCTMEAFVIIMLILGFACFAAAAVGISSRVNLVAAGLAFWILSVLVPALETALG